MAVIGRERLPPLIDAVEQLAVCSDPREAAGTVHHDLRGVVYFVARVSIDSTGRTALAWVEICPGIDGVLVTRQIAGTAGWDSAGFIEGREDGAILAYTRTATGIDWRVLLVNLGGHLWG